MKLNIVLRTCDKKSIQGDRVVSKDECIYSCVGSLVDSIKNSEIDKLKRFVSKSIKDNSKNYKKFLVVLFAWQGSIEKIGNFQISYLEKLLFQRYLDNISLNLSFNIIEFAKKDIEFVIQNIFEKCPTLRSHLNKN